MNEAYEFLRQGGWPMIPLGVCSLIGLAIIFERALALRRGRVLDDYVLDAIHVYRPGIGDEPLLTACRHSNSSVARLVAGIVEVRHHPDEHLQEAVNAIGRREIGYLERGLILLEIVAGISPLIGLLGTVLGMVTVFDAISAEGIGDPQVLSDGISKALVTTVAGLCIAIPALAFHSLFSRRVESLGIELQEASVLFLSRLHGHASAKTAGGLGRDE